MLARGVEIGSSAVSWLKRILLTATLVMNMVPAIWPKEGETSMGDIFAHAVIPTVIFFLAEVIPVVQARCTTARRRAAERLDEQTEPEQTTPTQPAPAPAPIEPMPAEPEPAPAPMPAKSAPEPVLTEPEPMPADVSINEAAMRRAGLPPAMHGQVVERLRGVLAEGRSPEPADLAATGLPVSFATRIIAAGINGHAVSA